MNCWAKLIFNDNSDFIVTNIRLYAMVVTKYVSRVNQIDAIYLEKDFNRFLRENLLENLNLLSPIFARIQPEFDLLIQSAIWAGSVGKEWSSFGQQQLILAYDPEKRSTPRLFLHFVLSVLPNYLKTIDEQRLSESSEWIHKIIERCENIALVLSLFNFFRFLKTGHNPSLVDYILGLDYISLRNNQRRDIGSKYLTRELLWAGFMEILGLVLPVINFRKVQKLLKLTFLPSFKSSSLVDKEKVKDTRFATSEYKLTLQTMCVYCGNRPTLPHHMECGHIYCYYCLSANVCTDTNFTCTKCGANVTKIMPA